MTTPISAPSSAAATAAAPATPALAVGASLGHYTVTRQEPLPQLQGTYWELVHNHTGARHIHIACSDSNNAFVVAFPTIPQDSTGIAHILEHVVLAGSERFAVRDPFFSMIPRSLSTYMNASTYPAFTAYPFSTRNQKDYFNLLDVYLDAAFFPTIADDTFKQEGWRFEFADGGDATSPLKYKGVVFNEMKGAMASVPSIVYRAAAKAIFPDLTYGNNAGGDPKVIPKLTHQALRAFHARHYHPSNAYFYTYGNLPLDQTLAEIESHVMGRFTRLEIDTSIPDQPRFTEPRSAVAHYPLAESEIGPKKAQVLVSFLTTLSTNSVERLSLEILSAFLLSNAASPLRKALLESGLGSALADSTGFSATTREATFSVGLKDVRPEDAEVIEQLILDTFASLAKNGVDNAVIDGIIHRLEIISREVSNAGAPYSLKTYYNLQSAYINGGDPYRALQFEADIEAIEAERQHGGYFEGLIRRHFMDNTHRTRLLVLPDTSMTEQDEVQEAELLAGLTAELSEAEKQAIVAEAAHLKQLQDQEQDLSVLPILAREDIPMHFERIAGEVRESQLADGSSIAIGSYPQPTNGISYIDLQFNLAGISEELFDLLPAFAFVAPKMGAGASDYGEMARRIEANTGGIGLSVALRASPNDPEAFRLSLTLSAKALYRKHQALLALIGDLVRELHFDAAHLRRLLGQYRAALEGSVVQVGHSFALSLARAQLRATSVRQERLEGLTQLALAKRLAALDDDGIAALMVQLEALRDFIFALPQAERGVNACITSEVEQLTPLEDGVSELLLALPRRAMAAMPALAPWPQQALARSTAVPVAYNARLWHSVAYGHSDAPVFTVLAKYLRTRFIHREIREKGGAYGGYAVSDSSNGLFGFLTYRDPHIVRSFATFDGALQFVLEGEISAEGLHEAILAACSDADPLESPESKGRSQFFGDLSGYNIERREAFKRGLLAVTADDLRRVVRQYLIDQPSALAVISSPEKLQAANAEMGDIFEIAAI
jgi:presequence protease